MKETDIINHAAAYADDLLASWWGRDRLIVDPIVIARSLGIRVAMADLGQKELLRVVGGGIQEDDAIFVPEGAPPVVNRYYIAAGLGLLTGWVEVSGTPLGYHMGYVSIRSNHEAEQQMDHWIYAHTFARHLMVPTGALKRILASGEHRNMAIEAPLVFGVSGVVAHARMRDLKEA